MGNQEAPNARDLADILAEVYLRTAHAAGGILEGGEHTTFQRALIRHLEKDPIIQIISHHQFSVDVAHVEFRVEKNVTDKLYRQGHAVTLKYNPRTQEAIEIIIMDRAGQVIYSEARPRYTNPIRPL